MRSGSSSSSSRFKIRPKQVNASTYDFDRCCLQSGDNTGTHLHVSRKAICRPKQQLTGKQLSNTMKAIRIHNYGGPEVVQYEDAPRPEPQAGEVLVRVHAAGVNPIDWKVREGHMKDFWPHKFPLILGW